MEMPETVNLRGKDMTVVYHRSEGLWDLFVKDVQLLRNAALGVTLSDGATKHSPELEKKGVQVDAFKDHVGGGERLYAVFAVEEDVQLELNLSLYYEIDLIALDVAIVNDSPGDLYLNTIIPLSATPTTGGGLLISRTPSSCTVLGNHLWMGESKITKMDRKGVVTNYWSSAICDTITGKSLVVGIGETANATDMITLKVEGDEFGFAVVGGCYSDLSNRPLRLRAGRSFKLNRIVLLLDDNIHSGLNHYSSYVRNYLKVQLHRAYTGLFTAYSSDVNNETVIRLTEDRVKRILDIVEKKLKSWGVEYVKIEFGVCGSPGLLDPQMADLGEPEYIQPRTYNIEYYFPRGIRALTDEIHRRGFKAALQSRIFLYVKGGEENEEGKTVEIYRRAVEEWGFDYLMLDFNYTDFQNLDDARTAMEVFRDRFRTIRRAVGKDIFIEACMMCPGPVIGIVDGFRPSPDYRGGSENSLLHGFANRYYYHDKLLQLDTEFYDLSIRPFIWKDSRKKPVITPIEGTKLWLSLCGLTGYSFLVGGALEYTTRERFDLCRKILPVYGKCAIPLDLTENELPRIWVLTMNEREESWTVAGFFNWSYEDAEQITLDFEACGLDPSKTYLIFDFWNERFIGETERVFSVKLNPRNCLVLFLHEKPARPKIIGSNRHVSGAYTAESFSWDEGNLTISAVSRGPPHSEYNIYIYVPQGLGPRSCSNCECDMVEEKVLGAKIRVNGDGKTEWSVSLDPEAVVR